MSTTAFLLVEFLFRWSFKCTFKLFFDPGDFLDFPPFFFTVHVRLVLSPCQAGGYNISHIEYNHACVVRQ